MPAARRSVARLTRRVERHLGTLPAPAAPFYWSYHVSSSSSVNAEVDDTLAGEFAAKGHTKRQLPAGELAHHELQNQKITKKRLSEKQRKGKRRISAFGNQKEDAESEADDPRIRHQVNSLIATIPILRIISEYQEAAGKQSKRKSAGFRRHLEHFCCDSDRERLGLPLTLCAE